MLLDCSLMVVLCPYQTFQVRSPAVSLFLTWLYRDTKVLGLLLEQSIMLPDPVQVRIPHNYTSLPVKDIRVSHYPENASEATPIIVITLNRPKQGNAFTLQMVQDFELVYPMLDLDERVKTVVITGAGKMFCAGADLDIGFPSDGAEERLTDKRDPY